MIAHLAYVVCDVCGRPGTEPEEGAHNARLMLPPEWVRANRRDFCPGCAVLPTRDAAHPLALPGLEDFA